MKSIIFATVIILSVVVSTAAFTAVSVSTRMRQVHYLSSFSATTLAAKGFGSKPEKKEKSAAGIKREQESSKYDEIASSGGQEYNVFVRQFGSDDKSWLPSGAVAVPRGAQVADAIYANEEALKKAIVRKFPKLGGFENEFEFGFNLRVYPDDPIEVAKKGTPRQAGMSIGNWISNVLSPVDASGVKKPKIED